MLTKIKEVIGFTYYYLLPLSIVIGVMLAMGLIMPIGADSPTLQQQINRLSARVIGLEDEMKILKDTNSCPIQEYHFESAGGKFVCRACRTEE